MSFARLSECLLCHIFSFAYIGEFIESQLINRNTYYAFKGKLTRQIHWKRIPRGVESTATCLKDNIVCTSTFQFEDFVVHVDEKDFGFKIFNQIFPYSVLLTFNRSTFLVAEEELKLVNFSVYRTIHTFNPDCDLKKDFDTICRDIHMNDYSIFICSMIEKEISIHQYDLKGNRIQTLYEKCNSTKYACSLEVTNQFLVLVLESSRIGFVISVFRLADYQKISTKTFSQCLQYLRINQDFILLQFLGKVQCRLLTSLNILLFSTYLPVCNLSICHNGLQYEQNQKIFFKQFITS